jgi:hypothetical protein
VKRLLVATLLSVVLLGVAATPADGVAMLRLVIAA